jgi:hypothetical protein
MPFLFKMVRNNVSLSFIFNFAVENAIRKIQESKEGFKFDACSLTLREKYITIRKIEIEGFSE